MKKFSLIILLAMLSTFTYSQDIKTFGNQDTSKTLVIGYYGEPFGGATMMNNDWGITLGLKGGMTFNRHFGFGPIAKVNIGLWEFQGNNLNYNDSANLELYMGSIGIFLEYTFKMENKIHFSIPVNIMVGGATIKEDMGGDLYEPTYYDDDNKAEDVESAGLFIVEPELNIEFNVAKFFIPNIKVGYRAVFGSQMVNVTDQDLSGAYFGIGLKFGKF